MMMRLVSPEEEQTFQELTTLLWLERLEDKAQSREARLITALDQSSNGNDRVAISEVTKAYNEGMELKQQISPDSVGRRLRALGFKGDRTGSGARVIVVDRQVLSTLKMRRGLEFPAEPPEPLQKSVESVEVAPQLWAQIQKPRDTSYEAEKMVSEVSEKVSYLEQIQTDTFDTSAEGGEGDKVDYFLLDGTPVTSGKLIKRWQQLGRPQIEITPGDIAADLKSFLSDDVDKVLESLVAIQSLYHWGHRG